MTAGAAIQEVRSESSSAHDASALSAVHSQSQAQSVEKVSFS